MAYVVTHIRRRRCFATTAIAPPSSQLYAFLFRYVTPYESVTAPLRSYAAAYDELQRYATCTPDESWLGRYASCVYATNAAVILRGHFTSAAAAGEFTPR